MTMDTLTFREALAHVPTAVSVITARNASGEPWGVTVGTLGSLSLTPPLVIFCLDRASASHDVLTASARFLVHVLGDQQASVAAAFSRHGGHGFGDRYPTAHGLPTIPEAVFRLLCAQQTLVRGGDHTLVIGAVEDVELGMGAPLLYYRHKYHSLKRRIECPVSRVTAGSLGN
jgi:flavin reductase ActVB